MDAASACSRVSGSRDKDENNDDANNYSNNPHLLHIQPAIMKKKKTKRIESDRFLLHHQPQLPPERQTIIDRMMDNIARARRRVRFDSLKRSHDLLMRVLENERQRLFEDSLVHVSSSHPLPIQNPNRYRWEDVDDVAGVSEEQVKAAALRVRGLILLIDECRLHQRLIMRAAVPPLATPRLGPYSALLAANDDRADEIAEEELMYARLFGNF